jgi:hypothetical protein
MKSKSYSNNILIDNFEEELKILSWTEVSNTDTGTNNNYSDGFILRITDGLSVLPQMEIFISKNKRSFTIPLLNEIAGYIVTFIKQ